ncbi:MAG: amidase [Myxococcota bacterium]
MPSVSAFVDDVLGDLDAVAIRELIANREITAAEAVEAAIARAERVNPTLNAIATPCFDSARATARRTSAGAFAGVPSFVKDTDEMKGVPLLFGSRGMPSEPSKRDSAYVSDLRALGLVMLGKSTTPEFGLTGTTEALAYGPTRNPWNPDHTPGGSSGGAAALVASGVVPIAHANDGGGSIRIPAACCGIVGLKPSRGRLADVDGAALIPVKIIHQGIVSRTVRDTAAFYAAIERVRPARRLPKIGLVEGFGPRRRIRFFSKWGSGHESHPECTDAVERMARLLESQGHVVEEIPPPFGEPLGDDFLVLWSTMAFSIVRFGKRIIHPRFDPRRVEPFTTALGDQFKRQARAVPGAVRRLRRFQRKYEALFDDVDVLLTPALATPPPRIGYLGPEVPYEHAIQRLRSFLPFSAVQNISGGPAVSLPAGQSQNGLPLGVQLAGALGQERLLLELAFEIEAAAPFSQLSKAAADPQVRASL